MRRSLVLAAATFLLAAGLPAPASATLSLAAIFGDGMVLQRDQAVAVWGTTDPAETVTVQFQGQTHRATAAADGTWKIVLQPVSAGGPHNLAVSTASGDRKTMSDVLVGEVWLCSGQSNMAMNLRDTDVANAVGPLNVPALRLFRPTGELMKEQGAVFRGRWEVSTPDSAARFSAICYGFGHALRERLGVPVGLINTAVGGSRAEAWIDAESFVTDPELDELRQLSLTAAERNLDRTPAAAGKGAYRRRMMIPSLLFDRLVKPIAPYGIRGVVWYQGESNGALGRKYEGMIEGLVASWRKAWRTGDLPFLLVQLPGWGPEDSPLGDHPWADLRAAQQAAANRIPNTAMVVAADLGDSDMHPRRKWPIAQRLLRAALKLSYGQPVSYSGPTVEAATFTCDTVEIRFGNVAAPLQTAGAARGFQVRAEDGSWHAAKAEVVGRTVVLRNRDGGCVSSARYGWGRRPELNLYDADGLPAAPFHIDRTE